MGDFVSSSSELLEFSASDDLSAFMVAVEREGHGIDELAVWYGRRIGSKEMGLEERTPLMIASMFGSKRVVNYILEKGGIDVNKTCGSDGATALHCTVAGGFAASLEIVRLLPSLPDIKNGIYGTDEFRMYTFKIKPCSRAYSHDWTECPFVHPDENARRRDPRKYHYSYVPCPDFHKGTCQRGDACEYAHGIFECWLHPAQYRTRLCKDETNCTRRVCFFAHKPEELRPLYASTGSAVPSPRSFSSSASTFDIASISPLALSSPSIMMPPPSTPPMTPSGASSPIGGSMWPNQPTLAPPNLQLPGSRLKAAINARDIDLDAELLGLDGNRQWRQQLLDDLSSLSILSYSDPQSPSPSPPHPPPPL
ncbi:zinc finger CCCH domain-containing protein 66-like [Coffea arabica]|uniref:Zinc finger CCCH domain-containing protein 66-like n=1 Tax=Coffea arabica TaxID=13443 RepID=A0A6P6X8Y9_COFAR